MCLFTIVQSIAPRINAGSVIFVKWFIFNLHTEDIFYYKDNAYL